MPSLLIASNIVKCLINGRVVGQVTSFSFRRQSTPKPMLVVDQFVPAELIRGPVLISGQIGLLRVQRDGGPEALGLMPPTQDISVEQYVSIQLKDLVSDTVLFQVDSALIDSESWEQPAQDLMHGQVSFMGLQMSPSVKARSV